MCDKVNFRILKMIINNIEYYNNRGSENHLMHTIQIEIAHQILTRPISTYL